MKKTQLTSMITSAFVVSIVWGNEITPNKMTDILNPDFQKQEQKIYEIFKFYKTHEIDYEIKIYKWDMIGFSYRGIIPPVSKNNKMIKTPVTSYLLTLPNTFLEQLDNINTRAC